MLQALKLSKSALGGTSAGQIVNLLSNDVSRFEMIPLFVHELWLSPAVALIIMYLLYREASYAGVLGVLVVFIITPLQSKCITFNIGIRKK